MEARRRLFYVAMTRAETHLQISWSREDARGKEMQPSQFVDELLEQEGLEKTLASVSDADLLDAEWIYLSPGEESVRAVPPPAQVLEDLLDGFRFSPSSLNRFLQCPLAFYYEHLLKVPVPFSNAALMGTAVHQALERLFGKKERTQKDLLNFYREEMERIRGLMDPSDWEQRLDRGLYFLPLYFREKAPDWPDFSLTEFRIREMEVGGVPVTGIVDRIDLIDGNKAVLMDYKTGRYRKERAREPNDRNPQGGAYWRQLQFYNLLLKQNPVLKGRRLDYGLISFVEPDREGQIHEHRVVYDQEGEAWIRKLLQESWKQVRNHEFLEGCGKTDCSWCNFTRHNMQVSSFANEEQEGLDDVS
jgi:DNA helicase-2/ATP-dependent DNA helicase PcrA